MSIGDAKRQARLFRAAEQPGGKTVMAKRDQGVFDCILRLPSGTGSERSVDCNLCSP
jgi:hypothetical protein